MLPNLSAPNMYHEARRLIAALPDDYLLSDSQQDALADVFAAALQCVWYNGAHAATVACGNIIKGVM